MIQARNNTMRPDPPPEMKIPKKLKEELEKMKVDLIGEGISCKYVPDEKVLGQCFALGKSVAEKLPK